MKKFSIINAASSPDLVSQLNRCLSRTLAFLLLISFNLFYSQIFVSGEARVVGETNSGQVSSTEKSGSAIMYLGEDVVVTNLENIRSDNPRLKLVIEKESEKKPIAKSEKKTGKKVSKSLEPKTSSRKIARRENPKSTIKFSGSTSSENFNHYLSHSFQKSTLTNLDSKVKAVLAITEKISTDYRDFKNHSPLSFWEIKHDFRYLLSHITRPPPSFS